MIDTILPALEGWGMSAEAQILLPEPLYRELRHLAEQRDWSLAEVIRRGAEAVARDHPPVLRAGEGGFVFPPPIPARLLVTDPTLLKAAIRDDQEPRE